MSLAALGVTMVSVVMLLSAFAQTRQHLHRNRLYFWFPVLSLLFLAELQIYFSQNDYGDDLIFVAVVILGYSVLSYHIPDVRDLIRRFSIYFLSIIFSIGIYITGVELLVLLIRPYWGSQPFFVGAVVAVITAVQFSPLVRLVSLFVNRLFKILTYDSTVILRTYSASVSNLVDLDKLASEAIGTIVQVFEIDKGFLFLVDLGTEKDGRSIYNPVSKPAIVL